MGTIDKRYAPPADLRLRGQCEAVVKPLGKGQRIVRFESLRGEEWARAREECQKGGFEIGSRDRLVEIRHAKDQRNPYERAAGRALRSGKGKHAGTSRQL